MTNLAKRRWPIDEPRNGQPISEKATLDLPLSVPQRSDPDSRFESSLPSHAHDSLLLAARRSRCEWLGAPLSS
jgi:hypothetical protein